MASLYLINRSGSNDTVIRCLGAASAGDSLLFYENGVYACTSTRLNELLEEPLGVNVFALRHDVDIAGIDAQLDARVRRVDDGEFVDLVVTHSPIIAWT